MTTKRLSASGVVTYWTTSEMNLDTLRAKCLAFDPGLEKILPKASTPMNALRQALEALYPGKLIRTLNRNGFSVVLEDRGQVENNYANVAAAWFDESENLEASKMDAVQFTQLKKLYKGHRGILQPAQAGAFLGRVVGEYLGGVMLRPKTGGVYWLPADRVGKWEAVGAAIEAASIKAGEAAVYIIRHEMDENAVRAVKDALVHEMNGEAERMNAEICSGDLKEKALQARERDAAQLIEKVKRYESILDTGLAGVRKALNTVKDAAAAAALIASVQEPEPATAAAD